MAVNNDKIAKQTREYIQKVHKEGHSYDAIAKVLIKHGYPKDMVNSIIKEEQDKKPAKEEKKPTEKVEEKPTAKQEGMQKDNAHAKRLTDYLIYSLSGLLIIIIIAAIIIIYTAGNIKETACTDKQCFVDAANACGAANYTMDDLGTEYVLKTKRCEFTKSITKVADDEPSEIKQLLEGKSYKCSYAQGNFTEAWVDKLSIGLEACNGSLKDAIYDLVLAEFQTEQ